MPLSLGMPANRHPRGRQTHPERLRTLELPPSGLAPQGTRPEGSVDPGSKSMAAPPSPEAGNGQVVGGRDRHIIIIKSAHLYLLYVRFAKCKI